ncbi:MAG: hypothetical protein D6748_06565 [Calditrichaeota bacterium]|nr:MAG: hypothetical protein D6748_06565 [Calditrichota bacterium]
MFTIKCLRDDFPLVKGITELSWNEHRVESQSILTAETSIAIQSHYNDHTRNISAGRDGM